MRGSDPSHDRKGVVVAQAQIILNGRQHMKDKRTIVSFVLGFVVAALPAGIYGWQKGIFRANDDEPIVVAGGSLDITSVNGWGKNPNSNTANHNHTKSTINSIEILYGYEKLPGGRVELEIAYCPGVCANVNNPDDKVTIKTDADGTHLTISNSNPQHKMGDEGGSTTISHQPPNWKVNRIRDVVNSRDYACDSGKCQVRLNYHCDNPGHCQ